MIDWGLAMQNFKAGIDLALRSRRRDPESRQLHGALFELVGHDWALTEARVESRNTGEWPYPPPTAVRVVGGRSAPYRRRCHEPLGHPTWNRMNSLL